MAELPSGTVTFLFTDIEGSTRLWEKHPAGMRSALARHDELIRRAVESNDGYLVKSTGDGAYAVFSRAENAAAAAVSAQSTFAAEHLPDVGRLRVRMALHTGEADERAGDYFGTALNRAARLLSAGHGGQILVSGVTKAVLSEQDHEFIDLGTHRLRDLTQPEHVHQLLYPGSPREFAPLKSVDAHPNNLPPQLTSFVGRDREVDQIVDLMMGHRLVTLTGVGGAGKTRLALQVAGELLESNGEGAWFVDLAPLADPGLVVSHAAAPFGVRELETDPDRVLVDVLCDYLADKNVLLLLDNCEHVLEEVSRLAGQLLVRCPDVNILATSRGLLGIHGEAVFPVPPLGASDQEEAVTLFVERAASVQPGFQLVDANLDAVRAITEKLEGLPLAIELAASKVNVLSPAEILSRLDDQLQLITSRRTEGRHSTLEAAMDWSYDLLTPADRELFQRLSVFAGGWTLEAAESVSGHDGIDVLESLAHLVDQSLVETMDGETGRRYRLLEPVRQYAEAKLAESLRESDTGTTHAEYYTDLAEKGNAGIRGPEQNRWSQRIRADHDNIRVAIERCLASERVDVALRLTSAMGWFWWFRGHWREAMVWFDRVYRAADSHPVARARLVYGVACIEVMRARPGEVRPLFEEALAVLRQDGTPIDVAWAAVFLSEAAADFDLAAESVDLFGKHGDEWGEAYARFTYGDALLSKGDDAGIQAMEDAIDGLLATGDRWTPAWFGFVLGHMSAMRGEYERAGALIEQSRELVEGADDRWIAPHCSSRLGVLAVMTGDARKALHHFEEALPVHQRIGDQNCTALINTYLIELKTDQGDFESATEHLRLGLEGYTDLRNPTGIARAMHRAGWLALAQGEHERAARLLGAADGYAGELRMATSVHDRGRHDRALVELEGLLGPDRAEELRGEGLAMTSDERVAYALGRQGS